MCWAWCCFRSAPSRKLPRFWLPLGLEEARRVWPRGSGGLPPRRRDAMSSRCEAACSYCRAVRMQHTRCAHGGRTCSTRRGGVRTLQGGRANGSRRAEGISAGKRAPARGPRPPRAQRRIPGLSVPGQRRWTDVLHAAMGDSRASESARPLPAALAPGLYTAWRESPRRYAQSKRCRPPRDSEGSRRGGRPASAPESSSRGSQTA